MFEKGYSTKGEDRGIGLNKIKEYQDKYGLNEGKLKNVTENSNFIVGFYTLK